MHKYIMFLQKLSVFCVLLLVAAVAATIVVGERINLEDIEKDNLRAEKTAKSEKLLSEEVKGGASGDDSRPENYQDLMYEIPAGFESEKYPVSYIYIIYSKTLYQLFSQF